MKGRARDTRDDRWEGLQGAVLTQEDLIRAVSLRAASGGALAVDIWNGDSLEEKRSPKRDGSVVEQVGVGLPGGPALAPQDALISRARASELHLEGEQYDFLAT